MNLDIAAAADLDQRRHLTIFFSDLSDSTRIAASMEPEDYAELLQQLRDLCEQIIPRHGGEIVRIDGDGVLCIFGYPVAHDDAGRRATEAALDLHNAASVLDQSFALPDSRIRLHTGIHSGIVLVRPGDIVRGRFEMLGDATNVAARLCDHAAADEVLVSEASLGADLAFFTVGPRRKVSVSGRGHGLSVYPVVGREPTANRFAARVRRGVAPFAGRAAQIARLEALLDECRAGGPRLAVLAGPAGIGKTRLANEFLDRAVASGATGLLGYCEAYLGARPLQPFVQILSALTGEEPRAPDAALVPGLLIPALADAASGGPVILSIDDWQWADDAARRLLDVIRAQALGPLLILLSTRDDDPALAEIDGGTIIPVPPLAPAEAVAAIEGLVAAPGPFLVERIRDQSGGSPLFIEELCHAASGEHGDVAQGDRNAWLDMLVQTRFARLPADEAALVRTAAVIGHILPVWLFEAITDVRADDPVVRRLMDSDFIYEGETSDTLRFKHGLARDAIYRTVGLKARQALHRRAAEALEARSGLGGHPPLPESLAYHFAACGNVERAMHYSTLAGDAAMAVPALDRAQAHYREALTLLASLEPTDTHIQLTSRIVHKFGLASVVDPSPEQLIVLEVAERLTAATHNAEGLTYARYWSGALLYGVGRPRESVAKLEQALADAAKLDRPRLVDQLQANLGQSYFANCQYAEAEALLDTAITGMRARRRHGLETGLVYAIGARGLLFADQGRFERAYDDFGLVDDVLGTARPVMFGSILNKRSVASIWQGQYNEAVAHAEAGIAHGTLTRSRYYTMMSRALLAYASWKLDRQDNRIDDLAKATAWFEAGASQHRTSLCHGWLAEAMSTAGNAAATRRAAGAAFNRARKGDRLGEALACRSLARVAASGGESQSAARYLARAYRAAEARGSARETAETRLCEAEIALSHGDIAGAARLAGQAKANFAAMGMDDHVIQAAALVAGAAKASSH